MWVIFISLFPDRVSFCLPDHIALAALSYAPERFERRRISKMYLGVWVNAFTYSHHFLIHGIISYSLIKSLPRCGQQFWGLEQGHSECQALKWSRVSGINHGQTNNQELLQNNHATVFVGTKLVVWFLTHCRQWHPWGRMHARQTTPLCCSSKLKHQIISQHMMKIVKKATTYKMYKV